MVKKVYQIQEAAVVAVDLDALLLDAALQVAVDLL